jgi:acyl carrier protein
MSTTYERLAAILMKEFQLPAERLTLDTPLQTLDIDSLGTVELLWNIEDSFRIKLPTDPTALATVGDVVRFVDEQVARQAAAALPAGGSGAALQAGTPP